MSESPLRILVVEDDPHLRKLCVFALGLDEDLIVDTCESGEQALARVAEKRPDLVLLDLEMPGIGGVETAKRLHAMNGIAVVIVSGKPKIDLVEMGVPFVRGIVKKPFDPTTLAAEVRKLS